MGQKPNTIDRCLCPDMIIPIFSRHLAIADVSYVSLLYLWAFIPTWNRVVLIELKNCWRDTNNPDHMQPIFCSSEYIFFIV